MPIVPPLAARHKRKPRPPCGAFEPGPDRPSQINWGHAGNDLDLEADGIDTGIADRDGLWEQGHLAGRGPVWSPEDAKAARLAARRLTEIVRRSGQRVEA